MFRRLDALKIFFAQLAEIIVLYFTSQKLSVSVCACVSLLTWVAQIIIGACRLVILHGHPRWTIPQTFTNTFFH